MNANKQQARPTDGQEVAKKEDSPNFNTLLHQFGGSARTIKLSTNSNRSQQGQRELLGQSSSQKARRSVSYRSSSASANALVAHASSATSGGTGDFVTAKNTANVHFANNNAGEAPSKSGASSSEQGKLPYLGGTTVADASSSSKKYIQTRNNAINTVNGTVNKSNNSSSHNNSIKYDKQSTNSRQSSTATTNNHKPSNMIQPKSQQRLILEQVAAQYFLNNHAMSGGESVSSGRSANYGGRNGGEKYVGVLDYGDDAHNGGAGVTTPVDHPANGGIGIIEEEDGVSRSSSHISIGAPLLGLKETDENRNVLLEFLDGTSGSSGSRVASAASGVVKEQDVDKDDDDDTEVGHIGDNVTEEGEGGSDSNVTGSAGEVGGADATTTSNSSTNVNTVPSSLLNTSISSFDSKDITHETNIDRILEVASDYLSLGQNELALQAYRRAMKCAYANVITVKQQLMQVKQQQIRQQLEETEMEEADLREYVEATDVDLTKQQEREFELLLLQVASRVADIHNNMGVVHEMNRQFQKAQTSYRDALDVYHNTCRRFEQTGDQDVDRTHRNVDRMTLACNSEKERKALHEKAARMVKRVEKEKHFASRKNLLSDAVSTLQQALELEGQTIGETHPVAASTLTQMGKYHYEMREFDSAVMDLRQAMTILRNALGPNHPQVGKTILLLASVYERQGLNISPQGKSKDDAELELYVDALEPLKATLSDAHPEVGFLYVKIGYLYSIKGDRNLAILAYKAALKAYGEPSSVVSGKIHPEVVSIWARLTQHLMEIKLWNEVVVSGQRALYLLRRAKSTLFRDAQLSTSSSEDAKSASRSKKSQIQLSSATYYNALFTTLQCLGQAHTSLSQLPLAKEACFESLQLAWEMALATNSNSNTKELLKAKNQAVSASILQVIRALKRLGKVYLLQKHYNDALQCFLPSLQLLRSSKEMESTLDAASVLGSLGFLYLRMEKFMEASNFLKECLRLYQRNGESMLFERLLR